MEIIAYLLVGVLVYFVGHFIILYIAATKLILYFRENPHSLPEKLPDNIQEFKDQLGEDRFNEVYKLFQERNN